MHCAENKSNTSYSTVITKQHHFYAISANITIFNANNNIQALDIRSFANSSKETFNNFLTQNDTVLMGSPDSFRPNIKSNSVFFSHLETGIIDF